jgi:hypothetical protein
VQEEVTELWPSPFVQTHNFSVQHGLSIVGQFRGDRLAKISERIEQMAVAGNQLTSAVLNESLGNRRTLARTAVVDVRKDEIVRTLHFDSETGMPQYDPVARKVYVNLQDQDILAVIDPATDEVVSRYPVGRCKGNHGMALDPERHRAFLACEGNELMAVFDLDKHAPIAFLPLPGGPDVIKFDAGLGRIYVACYSGAISVFHEDDADHYRKLEDFRVQHAVHSLAVDLKTHRIYTPEQEEDGKPVARMVVYEAVVTTQ